MIGRSIFLAGVEQSANAEIEQEAAEFARFAEDAAVSGHTTPEELVSEYVARQSVHENEVVVASVGGEVIAVANGRVEATDPAALSAVPGEKRS
ncbi:hypothetical protein JM654_22170 [Microbacterium oxydans]|nr:hypothetical protein [Microbacterium oxydans]